MSEPTRFLPRARVIPASELGVILEADLLRQQIRISADEQAQKLAQIEAETRVKAERRGLQEGRNQALRTLSIAITEIRTRLLAREAELAQVVVAAVTRIIGEVPAEDRVRATVRKALEDLADQTQLVLAVCPEERAAIATSLGSMVGPGGSLREVRADPALSSGDMVLEAGHTRYNIGLTAQLQRLADGIRAGTSHT
jgi:type III secretion protein L